MSAQRVLLIIPTLDRSGAEKQFTLLATGLPREEFDVRVIALTRGGPYLQELEARGIPVSVLGKIWKFDPLCLWRLSSIVREWQPALLHTWLFAGNAYGRMVAGGPGRPPVVVSERCVDSWKSGWQLKLDRRQISRTARLVGNSQSVADFYRQQGFPEDRLRVVPNGIALPEAADQMSAVERNRQRGELCGIPPDAKVLGFVGRLAQQKRILDLIWMLVLINNVRKDVYLILAGDGPERPSLEQFCRDLNVESRVIFLGHRSDVAELMPLFDVFCLASGFEGMSNSLMEAMACGLPVIASDIPPNRELVDPEQTGYLVPVGDRATYARAAQLLIENPQLRSAMGSAARHKMATRFSESQMIDGYARIYREVIAERAAEADGLRT